MTSERMSLNQFISEFLTIPQQIEKLLSILVDNNYDTLSGYVHAIWHSWYGLGTTARINHYQSFIAIQSNFESLNKIINDPVPVNKCDKFVPHTPCHTVSFTKEGSTSCELTTLYQITSDVSCNLVASYKLYTPSVNLLSIIKCLRKQHSSKYLVAWLGEREVVYTIICCSCLILF